jgi:hypothetical protein
VETGRRRIIESGVLMTGNEERVATMIESEKNKAAKLEGKVSLKIGKLS